MKAMLMMLIAALLLAACAGESDIETNGDGTPTEEPAAVESIADAYWVLVGMGAISEPRTPLTGTQISAQFDLAQSRVNGSAGCNNYMGDITLSEPDMLFIMGPLATTRMACPKKVMAQETAFLQMMSRVSSYQIQGSKLYIYTTADEVLVFTPGEAPPPGTRP